MVFVRYIVYCTVHVMTHQTLHTNLYCFVDYTVHPNIKKDVEMNGLFIQEHYLSYLIYNVCTLGCTIYY